MTSFALAVLVQVFPASADDFDLHVPTTLPDWGIAPSTSEPSAPTQPQAILGDGNERAAILPTDSEGGRVALDGSTGQEVAGRVYSGGAIAVTDAIYTGEFCFEKLGAFCGWQEVWTPRNGQSRTGGEIRAGREDSEELLG
jgi:hypothetical protein